MKKHNIQLIEGNFTAQKAHDLLFELLAQKINYHRIRKFNNEERFGSDNDHSEKRIKALIEEKEMLLRWLNGLDQNEIIHIKGNIQLEVEIEVVA
jgi:hypothetical protein